jgi:hypothetical protein
MNANGSPNPNQCYQPSKANSLAITVAQPGTPILTSPSNLALSVTGLILNSVPSGQPRTIIITNTGSGPATGLSVTYPSWPSGTTSSSTCINGSTLAVGSSCRITVTPGATATSGCTSGIAPTPGIITVSAAGGVMAQTSVVVLGYGCIYQGGYVFSINDSTATTSSIGGTVVSSIEQATPLVSGVVWSSDGTGPSDVSYDIIPGIDETSIPSVGSPAYSTFLTFFVATYPTLIPLPPTAFSACNGLSDGHCNAGNILTFYNQYITSIPAANPPMATPVSDYAAGLCTVAMNGYSDWYLPALCEMDNMHSGCATSQQAIAESLPTLIGDCQINPTTSCTLGLPCITGRYWSSTEDSSNPQNFAFWNLFSNTTGCGVSSLDKSGLFGVRCVRAFTN